MDDFIALLAALFDALRKRRRTGPRRRAAFGSPIAGSAAHAPPAPALATMPAASAPPPPRVSAGEAAAVRARDAGAVRSAEAGLVSDLFARPQSLVAAFIVAEVLATPVALRDPARTPR